MQDVLTSISDVGGVRGTALFDQAGSCVAHQLRPPYEPILVSEVFHELVGALDFYAGVGIGDEIHNAVVRFDQGLLAHRGVGPYRLMALCDSGANLAMLSVAFNVAKLKLERGQGPIEASHSTSIPERDGSYSDMSWSGGSQSEPAGAIGIKVMRHLLETFIRYVGGDARTILESKLREMRATPRDLSAEQFADLIRHAARKVQPPQIRKRFVAEVLGDSQHS